MTRRSAVALLGAPALRAQGARVERDIVYIRHGAIEPKLDVYLPPGPVRKRPVVMWVHGGAWRAGSKSPTSAARLTARGYAVVSVQYRLTQVAPFPAQIHDCKAAVRWIRANAERFGFDPDRIGAWGASAGGHLVALLGTSGGVAELDGEGHPGFSSRVQCAVDFFGPTDLPRMNQGFRAGVVSRMDHDAADSPESQLVGGPLQQNRDKAARANPITYVSPDAPPFLILHGDKDPLVPLEQSELLLAALRKAGAPAELHVVAGAGHGFSGPEIDRRVDEFLDRHLKTTGAPAAGARWIAHRGGVVSGEFAENSPASVEAAVQRGYWMIEIDVRESKDGVLVVQHDPDFQRFFGVNRKVAELTWAEIARLRATPGGTRPMTFRELCERARGRIRLMIDTKEPDHGEAFYREMESAMRDNGLLESAYFIGTEESRKRFRGKARTGAAAQDLKTMAAQGIDVGKLFFLFEWGNMSREAVDFAGRHGVPVVPSINTFHYNGQQPLERGAADIRKLLGWGVTEFQIDSDYEFAFTNRA